MRTMLAAISVALLLGACQRRPANETGARAESAGVDTSVTSARVKDTTVVKTDTNVNVDTTKKTEHAPSRK